MIYWQPGYLFFLTTSTFLHYPYFQEDRQKQIVFDKISQVVQNLGIPCFAYSIAMNHYHVIFKPNSSKDYTKAKQIINGGVAFRYGKLYPDLTKSRFFWSDSKTLKILNEAMCWRIVGYICGNLLKHREVEDFKALKEYKYSSYRFLAQRYSDEFAQKLVMSVIEVSESEGEPACDQLLKCRIPDLKRKAMIY